MGCGSQQTEKQTTVVKENDQDGKQKSGIQPISQGISQPSSQSLPKNSDFALHTKTRRPLDTIDVSTKPIDYTFSIQLDYSKCIGCHNCARACDEWQGFHVITKGPIKVPPYIQSYKLNRELNDETHRIKMDTTDCVGCGSCVSACPVNALQPRNQIHEVEEALQSGQTMVAVLAPATRVGLAEAFGMGVGATCERQLVKALHDVGFHYVFDNLFGADITTREDAKEVLKAKKEGKGPIFTSCCPGWVNLCERKYPHLLSRLSTARSPHGSICSLIKKQFAPSIGKKAKDLCVIGIMPCTSKKDEAARKELTTDGVPDCDINITTREVFDFLKANNIEFTAEKEAALADDPKAKIDAPYNSYSGSAYIYGKTAGVTESVIRYMAGQAGETFDRSKMDIKTIFMDDVTKQSIKMIEYPLGGTLYKLAVATGGTALRTVADMVHKKELICDSVEMMACLHGCQGGGGQPKNMKKMEIPKRAAGLEQEDEARGCSSSFDNKELDKIYETIGKDVHKYFHTEYSAWK